LAQKSYFLFLNYYFLNKVDVSNRLMCAAEHGRKEIEKILLKQLNIDAVAEW
jgi:hypothetical protein